MTSMAAVCSDAQAASTPAELPEDAAIRRPSRCAHDLTCSHESSTHEQLFGAVSRSRCSFMHVQGARTCAVARSCWSARSPAMTEMDAHALHTARSCMVFASSLSVP